MATAGTGGVAGGGGFNEEPEDSLGTGLETAPWNDPIPGLVRRNGAGGQTLASLAGTGSVVQFTDVLAILIFHNFPFSRLMKENTCLSSLTLSVSVKSPANQQHGRQIFCLQDERDEERLQSVRQRRRRVDQCEGTGRQREMS